MRGAPALRRTLQLALLVPAMLAVFAAPAEAHPLHYGDDPTNWRSAITSVDVPADGVRAALGDDGQRISVTVTGSHAVLVIGYDAEPFLRITSHGVWVNLRSTTTWAVAGLQATPPRDLDNHAPPRWRKVSSAGTWRWHDIRTHWSGYTPPPAVSANPDVTQHVADWEVPLLVDGRPGAIRGRLDWVAPPTPVLAAALGVAGFALATGLALLRRWRRPFAATLVLLAVGGALHEYGAAAGRVGDLWGRLGALPGHGLLSLAVWSAMLATAALTVRRPTDDWPLYAGAMIGAMSFLGEGVPSLAVLWHSQAINALGVAVDRPLVAVITGVSLGLLGASVLQIRRTGGGHELPTAGSHRPLRLLHT
jgi:hypothetical protein